ncbi:hypothetical protein E3T35_06315 [Cryobacterium sp. TMT1-2-2]|uniref:AbiTii domain-containing protein n=1 Tax=Cryobacterium sp. TMT1-2-2 TaxID=1259233 RepID=UPI00106C1CE2|nr:hypothetical protein [Cryobacterium sp. TMT1-2-2]TFD12898.1 hypothetical protein E3T35_06315 [Cryobacterium sp. TMT1-2-2]
MTLLDDVISQASDGEATAMLRKLMIVAHRLKAAPLLTWVKNELNGYESKDDLPSYRGPMHVNVQALITGPMGSKGTNTLSSHGVPDGFEGLFKISFFDPLAGIQSLAEASDTVGMPWDPAVVGMYNGWIDAGKVPFLEYWGVYSATKTVPPSTLKGIVDIVRTKALEMALDLQSEFPDAGEVGGPTVEEPAVKAAVTHITNNIYGSVTGLAQGNEVRQKVTVKVGDLAGALTAAKSFLADEAVTALSKILTESGDDDEKRGRLASFAQSVKAGAVALAGGVAGNIAADGVVELANQFFGWASGAVS